MSGAYAHLLKRFQSAGMGKAARAAPAGAITSPVRYSRASKPYYGFDLWLICLPYLLIRLLSGGKVTKITDAVFYINIHQVWAHEI